MLDRSDDVRTPCFLRARQKDKTLVADKRVQFERPLERVWAELVVLDCRLSCGQETGLGIRVATDRRAKRGG